MREITYAEAIREALSEEMRSDPNVFLLGEDIGIYGGAFGVTKGMVQEFGEERVRDTPLSEHAITGARGRGRHDRHAARRGDHVQRFSHASRWTSLSTRRQRRVTSSAGQASDPHGAAHPGGRHGRRGAAFAEPRGVGLPRPGAEGRHPRHPV